MSARFEIVRTDAEQPWHARFRAANGRVVWTTENYSRRKAAERAIQQLGTADWRRGRLVWMSLGSPADIWLEVREIDERGKP